MKSIGLMLCSFVLLACGARTGLTQSGAASSSSGSGGGCSTTPTPITSYAGGVGSVSLVDAAFDGARLFVATTLTIDSGPSPSDDPTWRVRVAGASLGDVGPSQVALTRSPAPSISPAIGSIAAALDHRGLLTWDDADGCRFVALTEDGSPAAEPASLGHDACSWLAPTQDGFIAFSAPHYYDYPRDVIFLDATGAVVDEASSPVADPNANATGIPKPIALADGSLLLLWSASFSIHAMRVSSTGAALSGPFTLLSNANGFDSVASTPVGSGALVAATTHLPGAGPSVLVVSVGADGSPGAVTDLAIGTTATSVAVAEATGGGVVAWSSNDGGSTLGSLLVQDVSQQGAPRSAPVTLAPGWTAAELVAASAPGATLLSFVADQPGGEIGHPTEAYVARLPCAP